MTQLNILTPYLDDRGNEIVYDGEPLASRVNILFKGSNNRLVVARNARIVELGVQFHGDGGVVEIGPTSEPRTGLRLAIRVGYDSAVRIGANVGSQGRTLVTAVEGAQVTIGDDCMIAMSVEIRSDDAHPIYDVRTGERVNPSRSIAIGDHVWIAKHAVIMGGVRVGDGAVVGYRSLVTSDIPNNTVAVGSPARVVRRDAAWERPKLHSRPESDPTPRVGEKHQEFWNLTRDELAEWPARIQRPQPRDPAELAELLAERSAAAPAGQAATTKRGLVARVRQRVGRQLRRWGEG